MRNKDRLTIAGRVEQSGIQNPIVRVVKKTFVRVDITPKQDYFDNLPEDVKRIEYLSDLRLGGVWFFFVPDGRQGVKHEQKRKRTVK